MTRYLTKTQVIMISCRNNKILSLSIPMHFHVKTIYSTAVLWINNIKNLSFIHLLDKHAHFIEIHDTWFETVHIHNKHLTFELLFHLHEFLFFWSEGSEGSTYLKISTMIRQKFSCLKLFNGCQILLHSSWGRNTVQY